jgi:hypothetical protein
MFNKIRTTVLTALAALGISTAAVTVTEGSVSAASQVTFCFKWYSGSTYANYPVYLEAWQNGRWQVIRNGRTNASGCGTFSNTPTNVQLLVQASMTAGGSRFDGYTPYYSNTGTGGANLGTGTVYQTW